MSMVEFRRTIQLPVSVETLFAWHERDGAFERLSPPWDQAKVVEHTGGIRDGARVVLDVPTGPVHTRWVIEHRDYEKNISDDYLLKIELGYKKLIENHSFSKVITIDTDNMDFIENEDHYNSIIDLINKA